MNEYLMTAIVPVYNVEDCLQRCLESLIHQENADKKLEILLVDDGSQDRSGIICDEYGACYPNIRVIHKQNGGLSSARNAGLDQAEGRYILFVDADDYLEKNAVQVLEYALQKYSFPDAIVYNGTQDTKEERKALRKDISLRTGCVSGKEYLLEHYKNRSLNVEAWLYLYSRKFLNSHLLRFREGILHEDVEFTPRAMLKAENVLEIPEKLYHYVIRENSISTSKNKEKNIKDLFATLREQERLARGQDAELERWMNNAILDSYLNMVYDARMYKRAYRYLLDRHFLRGKAATMYNKVRACLCFASVRLYCLLNDMYKKWKNRRDKRKCA